MLISRAVPCVPSTFLQVAAEFYLRPRPIEVAASGPGSSAYASRHPVDYIHVTYDYDKLFYEAIWN